MDEKKERMKLIMKKFNKLFTLLLAAAMVLAMSVSVFAAKTADEKVTVSGLENGDTVNLYQVVKWSGNDGWTFVAPYDDGLTADEQAAVLAGNINSTLAEKIAEQYTSSTAIGPTIASDGKVEKAVDPGLYLVLVTPADAGIIYNPGFVASDYEDNTSDEINMSTAGYDNNVIMKKSPMIVTKTINDAHETDDYSLGDDDLSFTIATTVPSYPANSTYATLKISDTPKGMTIKTDSVVVKVGDTVVYNSSTAMPTTTGTVTVTATNLTVDFAKAYILANGGKAVTVTYTAELTSLDNEGTAENPVEVEYNPNPFIDTTNKVDDIDKVKTYGLVFEKVDSNGQPLEGAVFDLYDSDGNKMTDTEGNFITATTTVVNGHAYVYWSGLGEGTYTIKETTAPEGYMAVQDFTISVSATDATSDNPATTAVEKNFNIERTGDAAIVDPSGNPLPSTGGIGTVIFYVLGSLLVIGAGIVLVARRRMNAN
jgi:fimbrial isopeptide formation D2 family protein/LPXTG-motif cell wall-anchored protein